MRSVRHIQPVVVAGLAIFLYAGVGHAQKFYPDDPIKEDRDDIPIPAPAELELSPTYDVLENSFVNKLERPIPKALNINTLGEVPDSSWFTNRMSARTMSIEELVKGPNLVGRPDLSEPVTITSGKQGGITPGVIVRDRRGNIYFVKFDPRAHPNLSTSVDVIGKLFFHAFGFNVPENYIVYFRSEDFAIEPGAEVSLPGGKKAPLDEEYVELMLQQAAHHPDGSVRAVASLMLPGKLLGPFRFYGTRGDDGNDIFPHQHRRELRGYRVFCAWLNHDDSRSINTMDTFVGEEGLGYVKHYLIDFGSILGSGSDVKRNLSPQDPRAGNEYLFEIPPMLKTAYTFGVWERPWMNVKYAYPQFAEVGRIEADFFEPHTWKPEYPNPAFDRMLPDDAFWAAKIIARFSDEAIRAIVHRGIYLNSESERFLADIIIERRDKVVAHYFRQLNPLDDFRVDGSTLEFRNLGQEHNLAEVQAYEYEWFVFDNQSSKLTSFGQRDESAEPSLRVPDSGADYLMVCIRTRSEDEPNWGKAVEVYLRRDGGQSVVGIERETSLAEGSVGDPER